jgi:hypothetical protein
MSEDTVPYIARLIVDGRVHQEIEFSAVDDREAWRIAHEGIDVLRGMWVEVARKPDPQRPLDL